MENVAILEIPEKTSFQTRIIDSFYTVDGLVECLFEVLPSIGMITQIVELNADRHGSIQPSYSTVHSQQRFTNEAASQIRNSSITKPHTPRGPSSTMTDTTSSTATTVPSLITSPSTVSQTASCNASKIGLDDCPPVEPLLMRDSAEKSFVHVNPVQHAKCAHDEGILALSHDKEDHDPNSLQAAWNKAMVGLNSSSVSYKDVSVLLLSWDQDFDDLGVKEEVDALEAVFRNRFNYHVQSSTLKTYEKRSVQLLVNSIVANWVCKKDGPDTLLMVYYAGHGSPGQTPGHLELVGQSIPSELNQSIDRIVWNYTEDMLRPAQADVLQIFDCCFAGELGYFRGNARSFEYLAATTEGSTRSPGQDSFTSALIWALEELVGVEYRFTTQDLVQMISSAPHFPETQRPVLRNRFSPNAVKTITLEPLKKAGDAMKSSRSKNCNVLSTTQILHLTFEFEKKATPGEIEALANGICHAVQQKNIPVNRIMWGGIHERSNDALFKAVERFMAPIRKRRLLKIDRS